MIAADVQNAVPTTDRNGYRKYILHNMVRDLFLCKLINMDFFLFFDFQATPNKTLAFS
jgi:hypothetical protein